MATTLHNRQRHSLENGAMLERITANHSEFLRFLSSRVGERATAEDILQSAYVKAMEHHSQLRNEESIVAWFYRILRNAIIDYYRRAASRSKAHEQFAAETPLNYEAELERQVCACIADVIGGMKKGYREAIEHVDLAGQSVESFARAQNTTPNNASVRLHRARKALAEKLTQVCGACAEHKCLDCTCKHKV